MTSASATAMNDNVLLKTHCANQDMSIHLSTEQAWALIMALHKAIQDLQIKGAPVDD